MPTPTFRIYGPDKKKLPTLEHCFLREYALDATEIARISEMDVYTPNGVISYKIVWDDSIKRIVEEGKLPLIPAVISFQKHTYGNFAVIKKAYNG